MKIIVHNQENNISLRLPGWLVYGRFGIPPEMLGQLLTSLRDFARTHPGWLLVDITTHKGDIVKITL